MNMHMSQSLYEKFFQSIQITLSEMQKLGLDMWYMEDFCNRLVYKNRNLSDKYTLIYIK
jgi:hypothetical protein